MHPTRMIVELCSFGEPLVAAPTGTVETASGQEFREMIADMLVHFLCAGEEFRAATNRTRARLSDRSPGFQSSEELAHLRPSV